MSGSAPKRLVQASKLRRTTWSAPGRASSSTKSRPRCGVARSTANTDGETVRPDSVVEPSGPKTGDWDSGLYAATPSNDAASSRSALQSDGVDPRNAGIGRPPRWWRRGTTIRARRRRPSCPTAPGRRASAGTPTSSDAPCAWGRRSSRSSASPPTRSPVRRTIRTSGFRGRQSNSSCPPPGSTSSSVSPGACCTRSGGWAHRRRSATPRRWRRWPGTG